MSTRRGQAIEALHARGATCPACGRRLTWGCGHEHAQDLQIRREMYRLKRLAERTSAP